MSISTASAAARETARQPDGKFGAQAHPDPGQLTLEPSGTSAAEAAIERVNTVAAPVAATATISGGRTVTATNDGATLVLHDVHGARMAECPAAKLVDAYPADRVCLDPNIPDPPDPYRYDPFGFDPDDMQGRLGPDTAEWEEQYGDEWRAVTISPGDAATARDLAAANTPNGDGMVRRLDPARLDGLDDNQAGQVAAELDTHVEELGRRTLGEAIGRYGARPEPHHPGILTFPTLGRGVHTSRALWHIAGGQPATSDVPWPYLDNDDSPPF